MKQIREIQQIARAEDIEFSKMKGETNKVLRNMFVYTADELGVRRFEKILGIIPKATQSLDERKIYIISMTNKGKISLKELENMLQDFSKGICFKYDFKENEIQVQMEKGLENMKSIDEMMEEILPVNIFYHFSCILSVSEMLKGSMVMKNFRYNYKLGEWKLEEKNFATFDNQEKIGGGKMTVTEAYKEKILDFILESIDRVIINDTVIIAPDKYIKESTVQIDYIINNEQISEIKNIKVKSKDACIISEVETRIIINRDVAIGHKIEVEGGTNEE